MIFLFIIFGLVSGMLYLFLGDAYIFSNLFLEEDIHDGFKKKPKQNIIYFLIYWILYSIFLFFGFMFLAIVCLILYAVIIDIIDQG